MNKLKLHWQIILSLVLGIIFSKSLGSYSSFAEPLGDLFVRLLKMVTVPLVILSMITGVSNIGNTGKLGWLGVKTVGYYLSTSFLAILIGLFLVNWIRPGLSVDLPNKDLISPLELPDPVPPLDLILRIIPTNPLKAAVNGDMLAIIFFSLIFGICLNRIGGKQNNQLFVTTATKGMSKSDLQKFSYSGSLFSVKTNMKGFLQKKIILSNDKKRSLLR